MSQSNCPVCGNAMRRCPQEWRRRCETCGYEASSFLPTINVPGAHSLIDEEARESGLKNIRLRNFSRLVDILLELVRPQARLLDVGAAHGWFLEAARDRFAVLGIEPDRNIFERSVARGLPMRNGYFPDVMEEDEKVDAIVFNDVIEHIPAIGAILDSCRHHLSSDGVLLINLPSSRGVFYRTAVMLSAVGVHSFLDRLWQKGLPSPHLHYFHPDNLQSILRKHGFEPVRSGSLSTLQAGGLWTRICYTGNHGWFTRVMLYLTLLAAVPLLRILPSDIIYVAAKVAPIEVAAADRALSPRS